MVYSDTYIEWYFNSVLRGREIEKDLEDESRSFDNLREKEIVDYHTSQFHDRWMLAENWSNIDWLINQFPALKDG